MFKFSLMSLKGFNCIQTVYEHFNNRSYINYLQLIIHTLPLILRTQLVMHSYTGTCSQKRLRYSQKISVLIDGHILIRLSTVFASETNLCVRNKFLDCSLISHLFNIYYLCVYRLDAFLNNCMWSNVELFVTSFQELLRRAT